MLGRSKRTSSSSNTSGLTHRAWASARRMRQPPEKERVGRAWASASKERPASTVEARAGAPAASMVTNLS